jgi:hypothetical protein
LIIFGGAVLVGLVGVPLLIWVVGNRILGPYTHGTNLHAGPMALLGDFYDGLSKGWPSYWIVGLGPLVIVVVARAAWELIVPKRERPSGEGTPKAPPPPNKSNQKPARIEPYVAKDRL